MITLAHNVQGVFVCHPVRVKLWEHSITNNFFSNTYALQLRRNIQNCLKMTLFLNDNVAAHSAETVKNATQMFQKG